MINFFLGLLIVCNIIHSAEQEAKSNQNNQIIHSSLIAAAMNQGTPDMIRARLARERYIEQCKFHEFLNDQKLQQPNQNGK